jgi:hypothetical protein
LFGDSGSGKSKIA